MAEGDQEEEWWGTRPLESMLCQSVLVQACHNKAPQDVACHWNGFLQFWGLEFQDQGGGRFSFPAASPLACRWLSFAGCRTLFSSLSPCVLISYRDTSHIGLGPTIVISSYNHLLKMLISIFSHILRYWELGCQHMIWGDTVQPMTPSKRGAIT